MTGRLEGKCALVIGAGSIGPGWGNGKATAVAFAREGAKVLCADINPAAAEETAGIIAGEGGIAEAAAVDAVSSAQLAGLARLCVERFGRIDILDNNVGIVEVGGVVEADEQSWERVMNVNLKSCYLAMKHVIPVMVGQGAGSIINISSIASVKFTGVAYASYYASKAAMNHLTRTTAAEFAGKGVRVNAVLPGLMKTPMVEKALGLADRYGAADVESMWEARDRQVPMGRMGDAWDVANAAVFLASDESKYITGVELLVDGGFALR